MYSIRPEKKILESKHSSLSHHVMENEPHSLEYLQPFLRIEQVVPSRPPKLQHIPRLVGCVGVRGEVTFAGRQNIDVPAMNPKMQNR